jgi:hypothetical protein
MNANALSQYEIDYSNDTPMYQKERMLVMCQVNVMSMTFRRSL